MSLLLLFKRIWVEDDFLSYDDLPEIEAPEKKKKKRKRVYKIVNRKHSIRAKEIDVSAEVKRAIEKAIQNEALFQAKQKKERQSYQVASILEVLDYLDELEESELKII